MPLIEMLPTGADTTRWTVWGTLARIVVTDPLALRPAAAIVRAELAVAAHLAGRCLAEEERRAH